ncbi:hypothetical protein [Cupriavidus sp. UYPR2.512]|uniref:hypothetical protein n=1 Tax=Cupriavidus sp. UYPR2.512 TaxID=1080187 RepID=UPI00036A31C5|nr:hypothetical protein [Cupriavidus sp. UYPR2.512]
MRKVEKITVDNESGFVLNFSVQWLSSDGKWNTTEWNSGNYPVAQSRTTPPLDKIGVPADAVAVTPYVGGYRVKERRSLLSSRTTHRDLRSNLDTFNRL